METDEYPATKAPTAALIEYIRARYHDMHRRELPALIALARKVETAHANDAEPPQPDIALASCLGWDTGCYRLGWGGGDCDRTLGMLAPRPFTTGIALKSARLPTIYPQPHDIPLDLIVTEGGVGAEREADT